MKEEISKFIKQRINQLAEQFPLISFTYGFDKVGTQHIIEIEPDKEYKNEAYMLAEFDFVQDFITMFPYDEILFISNDPYIKIEKIIYAKKSEIRVDYFECANELLASDEIINAPFNSSEINWCLSIDENSINIEDFLLENSQNCNISARGILSLGEFSYALAA